MFIGLYVQDFLLIMIHNEKGVELITLVKPLCLDKIGAIKGNVFPITILKARQCILKSLLSIPSKAYSLK